MVRTRSYLWQVCEMLLPWIMLFLIGYYTVAFFFHFPYIGFMVNLTNQKNIVVNVYYPSTGVEELKPGDIILRAGNVTSEEVENDLRKGFFEGTRAGDIIDIVVERDGLQKVIHYSIPGMNAREIFGRFNSQWLTPFIFWLAGTVTLLFLKPRSLQRLLLALFCYLTAIWLSASNFSGNHFLESALVLRCAVWLSVPVYLHLHWSFPTPLRRLPGWFWWIIYLICIGMAVLSWLQLTPQNLYFAGLAVSLVGSLILVIIHLIDQPSERHPLLGLVSALGMVLFPVLVIAILSLFSLPFPFEGIAVLGLAALPGFYFYTLYRRQLTTVQMIQANRLVKIYLATIVISLAFCLLFAFISLTPNVFRIIDSFSSAAIIILFVISFVNFMPFLVLPALADEHITLTVGSTRLSFSANRTASVVFFLILETVLVLVLAAFIFQFGFPGVSALGLVIVILISGTIALFGFIPFRSFFDRKVLGISMLPESLAFTYSNRITTSLELPVLQRLILDEVLPSLLVREFAQLKLQNSVLVSLFKLRVTPEMLAPIDNPADLDRRAGKYQEPGNKQNLPNWVRLVIPLSAANEIRGYWLFGQRDPDDRYHDRDIKTIKALADQTALALVNIEQAEALRSLYYADIDRHEAERIHLASELHDDVLNQLAIISTNLAEDTNPAILAAYDKATDRIRDIINGLRPAMLNQGLSIALNILTDDLNERLSGNPLVINELPKTEERYDNRVELSLFRITQQACQNAIQHARCNKIIVRGKLTAENVELVVSDDGNGFPAGERINLSTLLAKKHFGLAGMYERAALIGAKLFVDSKPGSGSEIKLSWQKN